MPRFSSVCKKEQSKTTKQTKTNHKRKVMSSNFHSFHRSESTHAPHARMRRALSDLSLVRQKHGVDMMWLLLLFRLCSTFLSFDKQRMSIVLGVFVGDISKHISETTHIKVQIQISKIFKFHNLKIKITSLFLFKSFTRWGAPYKSKEMKKRAGKKSIFPEI